MIEKIGTVSAASVEKFTGHNWDEWIDILNEAGAGQWAHKEIAAHLARKFKLSEWWKHIVATGYEVHTGKKIEGRNEKGEYATVVTAALPIEAMALWKFLVSEKGLRVWLKPLDHVSVEPGETFESEMGVFGEFRTMREGARLRLTWQDPNWEKATTVQLGLVPKPKQKTMLYFQHEKLRQASLKEAMKMHWRHVIDEIRSALVTAAAAAKPARKVSVSSRGASAKPKKKPARKAKKP